MTSKKSKRKASVSQKSHLGSDSDSDDIDAFTTKFMSQAKKLSSEELMKLNRVETDSSDTTGVDSEQDDSNTAKDYARQNDPVLMTKSRYIDAQNLADDDDDSSEDDCKMTNKQVHDGGDDDSNHESTNKESDLSSDEEMVDNEHEKKSEDGNEEDNVLNRSDTSDNDNNKKKSAVKKKLSSEEESVIDETSNKRSIEDSYRKLRQELADLPFNELQKLKEKIGIKAYNQAMFGTSSSRSGKKVFKRENKNRPTEMSSRRPVPRFREVIPVKKKIYRDPRFDDLSGEYNERIFKQAYSFLSDVKQREKKKLLKLYEKEKNSERKRQIELLIKRMNQQERAEREKQRKEMREMQMKKKELELIKQGKKPYFLKKADQKKLELAEKYRELKKSGKVEKYLAKKRKKSAAKERKRLPNKHYVKT